MPATDEKLQEMLADVKNLVDQHKANLKLAIDSAIKERTTELVNSVTDVFDFQTTESKAKPTAKKKKPTAKKKRK